MVLVYLTNWFPSLAQRTLQLNVEDRFMFVSSHYMIG